METGHAARVVCIPESLRDNPLTTGPLLPAAAPPPPPPPHTRVLWLFLTRGRRCVWCRWWGRSLWTGECDEAGQRGDERQTLDLFFSLCLAAANITVLGSWHSSNADLTCAESMSDMSSRVKKRKSGSVSQIDLSVLGWVLRLPRCSRYHRSLPNAKKLWVVQQMLVV